MSEPTETYLEDEYHFVWSDIDIELVVERVREERGALRADFSPQSVSGRGFLPTQTIDLVSGESAKRYANVLGSRVLDGDAWFDMITKAQRLTRERYRSGEPSIVLRDVAWSERPRFLVYPLVEDAVRTIIFGDGGVSKSLHAMALAATVATGKPIIPGASAPSRSGAVVYLDWEDEAITHAERLAAICAGAGVPVPDNIVYMRRVGSLHESTREIRREIVRTGAVLAVVDSVGAACGGDPEKSSDVIRAFDAMRALGVAVVAIHHVTKDQKDRTKPFGSVYSPNLARLTWRLDREPGQPGEMFVRAQSYKGNNVGELPMLGHRVMFETDEANGRLASVRFTTAPPSQLPAANNSLRNRIGKVLQDGALTADLIAGEIGATVPVVRTQLNRHKDWFVHLTDGTWGLVDEAHTSGMNHQNNGSVRTVPPPPPIGRGTGAGIRSDTEDEEWVEQLLTDGDG